MSGNMSTTVRSSSWVEANIIDDKADIDIISTSSVHQGVPHVDFSLKIEH